MLQSPSANRPTPKASEVEKLLATGVSPTEVARKLGIGRSSVYRAMRERKIKRVTGVAAA
jgi:DNA invertase Pin-like site-specific DNA recombinase